MATIAEPITKEREPDTPAKPRRVRLEYLDGLRGLAALYVVLNHANVMAGEFISEYHGPDSHLVKLIHLLHYYVFNYGGYAVCVFIVLSGYCLMLPVVRSSDETLHGGIPEFVKRRARRICPPYFAILGICWLFFATAPFLHIDTSQMSWYKLAEPAFGWGNVLAHLTLMHAWTPWISKVDPPMWSVSVEWNIYFIFALLLLPLFKKLGSAACIVVAFALGLAPHFIAPVGSQISHPWMLGLFALGMTAAAINFSPRPGERRLLERVPWGRVTVLAAVGLVVLTSLQRASFQHIAFLKWLRPEGWGGQWPLEIIVGFAASTAIIALTQSLASKGVLPKAVQFLESRAILKLGVFSYSVYLIHDPVLEVIWLGAKNMHIAPVTGAVFMYLVAVPVAVAVAYVFHLAFERPFLSQHYKKVLQETSQPQ